MSEAAEIQALREEIAALREEVRRLAGAIFPQPQPYYYPQLHPTPQPLYPGGPIPAWSATQGGTDFSKSYGPNSP